MNLLFEIADRDIMFVLFIVFGILLFVFIFFYVIGKGNDVKIEKTNKEEQLFPNIKPVNKEQKDAKEELERVFKQMNDDLEKQKAPRVIEKFEQEQEENAVISYQELIRQAEIKKLQAQEPIKVVPQEIKEESVKIEPKEVKKFQNSDIISPVFGVQKNAELEKLEAYDNNVDFLNSLKDFRNNL